MIEKHVFLNFLSNLLDNPAFLGSGIDIVDVTENANAHPHYHSREVLYLGFTSKIGFYLEKGLSGSPSCWNWYELGDSLTPDEIYKICNEEIKAAITASQDWETKVEILHRPVGTRSTYSDNEFLPLIQEIQKTFNIRLGSVD